MRLRPERDLARFAVGLLEADRTLVQKALARFRREGKTTPREFGAILLSTEALDRARLEELFRIAQSPRVLCESCRGALRVYRLSLAEPVRCPWCKGILRLSREQGPQSGGGRGGIVSDPVLFSAPGEPPRVVQGVRVEDLEKRVRREDRRLLQLREALEWTVRAHPASPPDRVVGVRPAWVWRNPGVALALVGLVGVLILAVGLATILLTEGAGILASVWIGGLVSLVVLVVLVVRKERGADRRDDRILLSSRLGIVQVIGGWVRWVDWKDVSRIRFEGEGTRSIPLPARAEGWGVDLPRGRSLSIETRRGLSPIEVSRRLGYLEPRSVVREILEVARLVALTRTPPGDESRAEPRARTRRGEP